MICINCQKDLRECTYPDLAERIANLEKCPHLIIAPAVLAAMKAQAERNKQNQDKGQQSFAA
jgi:hypothetical protein